MTQLLAAVADPNAQNPELAEVFVSYSRRDLPFAEQLTLALEDRGFDAIVDNQDIDAAEAWKDRLGDLLLRCDSVVFVLSEHSVASSVCGWEVDEAIRLSKRVIPVVPTRLTVSPPEPLAALNYIHFYPEEKVPGSGFYDGVLKLERALQVDLVWLREATNLLEAATAWNQSGRHDDRLLRGAALADLDHRRKGAVEIAARRRRSDGREEVKERIRL